MRRLGSRTNREHAELRVATQQGCSQLLPLGLETLRAFRASGAAVPVPSIAEVTFSPMQVGVHPRGIHAFDALGDAVSFVPVAACIVPQRLEQWQDGWTLTSVDQAPELIETHTHRTHPFRESRSVRSCAASTARRIVAHGKRCARLIEGLGHVRFKEVIVSLSIKTFSIRRSVSYAAIVIALGWAGSVWTAAQTAAKPQMTVYKSSTCGCCSKWVEHMQTNGFDVKAINVDDVDKVKRAQGVPASAASCHTALVNGYVVEGHVPADAVLKMLKEKPAIVGLAVPGMPIGSPGMEMPNGQKDPYTIVSIDKTGKTAVYQRR